MSNAPYLLQAAGSKLSTVLQMSQPQPAYTLQQKITSYRFPVAGYPLYRVPIPGYPRRL